MRFPCTVPLSLISHGREEVTISVAKINYIREKSKVFLLVVGIYMPCSI